MLLKSASPSTPGTLNRRPYLPRPKPVVFQVSVAVRLVVGIKEIELLWATSVVFADNSNENVSDVEP